MALNDKRGFVAVKNHLKFDTLKQPRNAFQQWCDHFFLLFSQRNIIFSLFLCKWCCLFKISSQTKEEPRRAKRVFFFCLTQNFVQTFSFAPLHCPEYRLRQRRHAPLQVWMSDYLLSMCLQTWTCVEQAINFWAADDQYVLQPLSHYVERVSSGSEVQLEVIHGWCNKPTFTKKPWDAFCFQVHSEWAKEKRSTFSCFK